MILLLIDVGCRIHDAILRLARGAQCPVCWERTRHPIAHHHVNHSSRGL